MMNGINFRRVKLDRYHYIENIHFENNTLIITIDGKGYQFELKTYSRKLYNATPEQRERFDISPSGYGIHWPLIDEDLSIDGLLGITHSKPKSEKVS